MHTRVQRDDAMPEHLDKAGQLLERDHGDPLVGEQPPRAAARDQLEAEAAAARYDDLVRRDGRWYLTGVKLTVTGIWRVRGLDAYEWGSCFVDLAAIQELLDAVRAAITSCGEARSIARLMYEAHSRGSWTPSASAVTTNDPFLARSGCGTLRSVSRASAASQSISAVT